MQSVAYETTLTNSMARLQLTSSASTATPTSKKSFTHLSEEIILAIMHFLQNKELFMTTECDSSVKNFCLTARRFYQIRAEYIKSSKSELLALTALAIKYRNEIPPSLYKKLEIYGKSISKLNFTMNPLKKENEEAFCSCFRRPPAPLPVPRVLTYQSLPILFPHLTALSLGACGLGDRHLCILSANTSLTALDLTGNSGITDDGIAHLKVVTELVALSVKYCFQLTSNSIGYLLTLKKITYLNLTGCSKIDQSSVLYLHQLPMLRWLKIINCPKLQATKEELLRLKPNLQVITAQKERPKPDSNTSSQVSSKTTTRKDSAFPKPKPAVKVSPAFNGWIY